MASKKSDSKVLVEIPQDWKIAILSLDGGYQKICYIPDPEGHVFWIQYRNGKTIRRWGTTRGLSELISGPTSETILDDLVPEGKIPVRAIIDVMFVSKEKWKSHLTSSDALTTPIQSQS